MENKMKKENNYKYFNKITLSDVDNGELCFDKDTSYGGLYRMVQLINGIENVVYLTEVNLEGILEYLKSQERPVNITQELYTLLKEEYNKFVINSSIIYKGQKIDVELSEIIHIYCTIYLSDYYEATDIRSEFIQTMVIYCDAIQRIINIKNKILNNEKQ